MSVPQSITEKIASLPDDKQQEVFDFVEFIVSRQQKATKKHAAQQEWSEESFTEFSMQQAMRGIEEDTIEYTYNDLKER
jgi:hypothetical protein